MLLNFIIFITLFTSLVSFSLSYSVPTPTFELISPQGFRISIPDEPGIILFTFHGAVNREIRGVAPGDFNGEVIRPTNRRWVYENKKVILDPGDVLYYWIHVQHENRAYRLLEKSITIPGSSGGTGSNRRTTTKYPRQPPPSTTRKSTAMSSFSDSDTPDKETLGNDGCIQSKTRVRGRNVCQGELIFEDNFDILNATKWKKEARIPLDSDDAEFVSFQSRSENCYITNGHLHIVPNLLIEVPGYDEERIRTGEMDLGSECTGIIDVQRECKRSGRLFHILPPVVSARIRTKEFFSFVYGRVEIRAKLTRGDWLFPQIFLEPLTSEYGVTGYASGQMRVAFIRGNEILEANRNEIGGNRLFGGIVLTTGDTYRDTWFKSKLHPDHLGRGFHTYSLTWTDESITLSVDGNDYGSIKGSFNRYSTTHNINHAELWESGGFMAPFDKEFYLSLGVSAGGVSDFPDGCSTGLNRHLKPWRNTSPKAELKFWNDRDNWHRTWEGQDAGLEVDYVRIWAL